ncbi:hypothetical protein UFOVP456_43 [uncultured Caudovirales phage]|uniref:Uncharacterized protein n=1 Tax=uncultured Caudovirales phage TaxID=2100421 RepID=A0A6J5MGI7_9CAUD|nr:hypothetical protein UFOVP456_43 [uncultured Caudovirales phage]
MGQRDLDTLIGNEMLFEEQRRRTEQSLNFGFRQNPDQFSNSLKLSRDTGTSPDFAEKNKQELEIQRRMRLAPVGDLVRSAPKTAEFLSDPNNAGAFHDAIGELSTLEQILTKPLDYARSIVGEGVIKSTVGSTLSGISTTLDVGARAIDRPIRRVFGDKVANAFWYEPLRVQGVPLDPLDVLKQGGEDFKKLGEIVAPPQERRGFDTDVAAGVGQLGGQIATFLLTGGTSTATTMFAQGVDAADTKTKKDKGDGMLSKSLGIAPDVARDTTLLAGGSITTLTERYGLDKILNRVPPAIRNRTLRFLADISAAAGIESAQEVTEALLLDMTRRVLTNENAEIFDGALNEAGVAGVSAAIVRAALGVKGYRQAKRQEELITGLAAAGKDPKLMGRLPEKVQEFVAGVTKDGPVQNVFIPVEQFNTFYQSQNRDPIEAARSMGATNYAEAVALGTDVVVPIDQFAAVVAPTDDLQGLAADVKFSQGERTAREREQDLRDQAAREEEIIAEAQSSVGEADTPVTQQIREDMTGQLIAAGTERVTAEAQATQYAKVITNLAQRAGVDPLTLHNEYGLSVTRPLPDVLTRDTRADVSIDPLLDRLRSAQEIRDQDVFGLSLVEFVRNQGGILPSGELQDADVGNRPFQRNLLQPQGMSPDRVAELAIEAGYFPGRTTGDMTESDIFDALDEELRGGTPTYSAVNYNEQLFNVRETVNQLGAYLDSLGVDVRTITDNAQVRQLIDAATQQQGLGDQVNELFQRVRVQAEGRSVPNEIDAVANVESAFEFAGSQSFPTNRDFKLAIQERVNTAAKEAGVNLDEFSQGTEEYLVRIAMADGITALRTNANAVGWYNEKVTKALRLVSLIHPEVSTDPQAKFAFVWAMAVTSNGLKVDKNFELAEMAYEQWKASGGKMPTDIGIGTAAGAINKAMGMYNTLIEKHGFDVVERFMTTMQPAGEVQKFTGQKISGENLTTMVYGAAALGPKIGNGFFMNLYGRFEQLTMDRWLMRTWGRWTGTLVEINQAQIKAKRAQLKDVIKALSPADKKAFEAIIKRKLSVGDLDAVGVAIWKASQKPANRLEMAKIGVFDEAGAAKIVEIMGEAKKGTERVSYGDELRKVGNALTKYLDGQKEAPSGPPERGNIRKVFSRVLAELQQTYPALTMSDYQALLWYPEKRLYDAAKTADEATESYEDDEAPDYANAAAKLARAKGISDADIANAVAAVDAELQAANGAAGVRPGERGPGDRAAGQGNVLYQSVEQTRTPEFQGWFDAGFVADASGNALPVYHGGMENFGTGANTVARADRYRPFWVSPDRSLADSYGTARGGQVTQLYTNIKNPANLAELAAELLPIYNADAQMLDDNPDAAWTEADGDIAGSAYVLANSTDVMDYLVERGYDSVMVEERPGVMSYGILDPQQVRIAQGDTNILRQGEGLSDKRGFIQFGANRKFNIALLEKANLSTFLHETGHFYLEVMGDLAERSDATQQIKDDYAAILKYLGLTSRAELTLDGKAAGSAEYNRAVEAHERFARSNEAYLMEGKAPSEELRALFQKFKSWLGLIYKSFQSLDVKLTNEIREVFDRIYATDEEIAAAKDIVPVEQLFASAADMGVSEAEFAAYANSVVDTIESGKEALQAKLMKELQRERETWWKERKAEMRTEVEVETDLTPVYAAFKTLTEGKLEDGTPIRLNKEALVERYGDEYLKRLPRSFGRIYTRQGGMDPESAAEFLGFESGDRLIEALAGMRPRKEYIDAEVDRRMREVYGDMMTDGTIADEAIAALHNSQRENVLMVELKALRRKQREVAPFVRIERQRQANDRRQARAAIETPPASAFRAAAQGLVGQTALRDLDPYKHLQASRRAARESAKALAGGDYQTAAEAKQREILNHYMYLESNKAREEAESILKYAQKFEKGTTREQMGKAGGTYLEQIDAILDRYEFRRVPLSKIDRRQSLEQWITEQEQQGLEPSIDGRLLNEARLVNYRQVSIDELRAVRDTVKNIEHLARLKNKLVTKQKEIAFADAIAELVASAENNGQRRMLPPDLAAMTLREKAGDLVSRLDAPLLKMEQLVEWLDNGRVDGPWHTYLWNPIAQAQVEENDLHRELTTKIVASLEQMPKEQRSSLLDVYEIPGIGRVTRKYILSMALNMGNDENMNKMLRGHGWQLENVQAALDKLSDADWRFVQDTWNNINSLWPQIVELEKRVTGLAPKKVEARPFVVRRNGQEVMTLEGGYFPLVYDPRFSEQGAKQESGNLGQLFEQGYVRATTVKGHTEARNEGFAAPLQLDFELVLTGHLTNVIKDLTHREAIVAANKILTNPEIRKVLQETMNPAIEKQMLPWLRSVVNDRNGGSQQGLGDFSRWMMSLRANTVAAVMGFKATTAIMQITGLSASLDKVDAKYLGIELARFMRHPVQLTNEVRALSGEMRNRPSNLDRDIRAQLRQMTGQNSLLTQAQRFAFHGIAIADTMVTVPTWMAAYRKAIDEGKSREVAILEGDAAIRLTQGAGGPKDLAGVQRNNELMKSLTMFYSYFSTLYNRMRNMGRDVQSITDMPRFLAKALFVVAIPAFMGDLIVGRGPDDEEEYPSWLARKILLYPLMTIPLLRDVIASVDSGYDYKFTPLASGLEKLSKLVKAGAKAVSDEDDVEWGKFAVNAAETIGYLAGVPGTAQVSATGKYLWRVNEGEEEADNFAELLFYAAVGKRKEK